MELGPSTYTSESVFDRCPGPFWSVELKKEALEFDDKPVPMSATYARLSTGYYFYFPQKDFANAMNLISMGKVTYDVTIPKVGVFKAIECGKVSKLPKMKIHILGYEYVIDPESYAYP